MRSSVHVPIRSKLDSYIATRGIKKSWIADQMGISKSYFSQMTKTDENGVLQNAMSAEYLLKLSHVLGCKVEEIMEYAKDNE